MSGSFIIIHNIEDLYNILKEIEDFTKYTVLRTTDLNLKLENEKIENNFDNYVLISQNDEKKISNLNRLVINEWPIKIDKLLDKINISLLKKNYKDQSSISINKYTLDINSRKLLNKDRAIKLTQKETEIIIFLIKSKKGIPISKLQKEVWGHNLELETHTVETHIYRLRSKIAKSFKDDNFISSTKQGYVLKN